MKIDFKKELETASKGMIMIHDHNLLIKLIIRMIVRKLGVKHAAMLLYDHIRDCFILSISRGMTGVKVPPGFTRFTRENPIIKLFTQKDFRPLTFDKSGIVSNDINRMIWREGIVNGKAKETQDLLHNVEEQMQMLNTVACVPAYYRHKLMAVLLLGEKHDGTKFEQEELDFFAALASDAAMAIRNAQLFEDLKKESDRNRQLFIQTIKVLGAAIEAKDSYTQGHTERVTKYSVAIARQMVTNGSTQFDESFIDNLYIAGMLHDIGKIGVSEYILHKTGKLTDAEYLLMKQHTVLGAEIIRPLGLPNETIHGVLYHHERFDGHGYPEGLLGASIPISAAIIAVADAFDAMTSDRPYRKGLSKEEAIVEITKNSGKQFNPIPVKALFELYHRKMI